MTKWFKDNALPLIIGVLTIGSVVGAQRVTDSGQDQRISEAKSVADKHAERIEGVKDGIADVKTEMRAEFAEVKNDLKWLRIQKENELRAKGK